MEKQDKEMVPVPTPNDGVDPVWRRPRCEFCSRQDEFNKDLVASVAEVNGRILFGAQVYIEDNELKLYLDNSSNDFMQMDSVKIKYCPMCGRKFWHDKEKGMTNEEAKAHMDMLIAHKDKALKQQESEE